MGKFDEPLADRPPTTYPVLMEKERPKLRPDQAEFARSVQALRTIRFARARIVGRAGRGPLRLRAS